MNPPPVAVKVSCLVVNYFSAKHMAQALQSVLQQQLANTKFQISLDVVVVDNSCNAQEAERLHELVQQLQDEVSGGNSQRPHVQVIVNPQNTGFGEGNNLAFKHCVGSLVLLLNPDARMQPNCLLELTSAMLINDKLGACCPMQYWDHSHQGTPVHTYCAACVECLSQLGTAVLAQLRTYTSTRYFWWCHDAQTKRS